MRNPTIHTDNQNSQIVPPSNEEDEIFWTKFFNEIDELNKILSNKEEKKDSSIMRIK